ncbi:hypothetical protein EYC80_004450 [Monilinia laxa]|uniref:Uncharacterized protein n=1 Tax=Monilinia laxa TaxID=61186 RepID=A0A5N6KN78_MONLA|nr:hypothetical protein EYC80_004450 [Monilinia laxa]
MIQERVHGETLEHGYSKLYRGLEFANPRNPHLQRRCSYARAVAGFVAQIDRVEMPGYGVFAAHVNMPEKGTQINAGVGDDAKALPRIVTRKPPSFLWNMTESPLLPEEKAQIKMAFDEEMRRLSPDRGYEGDAYEESRVLVRALCMYALFGPGFRHHVEISFKGLVGAWGRLTGRF